ncbi:type II toxin-antitoxin system HicA family toxin [Sphaerothrix gracilis]|uniref:type II toxin-antitoxin system HicA family toxin n=1 Tax=Sphaerothrix gracilis TaxID=3151835 RepID=UPI0031FCC1B6
MSKRIRRMKAREVEKILSQHGFELISQKGSHRKWRNSSSGLQVIVPEHRGKDLPIGTLRSILKGAEIPQQDWQA